MWIGIETECMYEYEKVPMLQYIQECHAVVKWIHSFWL